MGSNVEPQALAAGLLARCEGDRALALLILMQAKAILEDARIINETGEADRWE